MIKILNLNYIHVVFCSFKLIIFLYFIGSVYNQPRETTEERKLYTKLKALNRYHKRSGVEAILHKKALERRAQVKKDSRILFKYVFHLLYLFFYFRPLMV